MRVPGAESTTPTEDIRERAEREAEELRETLKKEVRFETTDMGGLRKELSVTVPAPIIAKHVEHHLKEVRQEAVVPGFRRGRAPRELIQKRFGSDISESLKTTILGQSFLAVIENAKLEILGDPLFKVNVDEGVKLVDLEEALTRIELPKTGDFQYICEVEVRPEFELSELTGIEVKTPRIEIDDESVQEEIERQQKIRGRYEPLEGEGASESDDMLVVDARLTVDGTLVKSEENLQLGVRPARLDGIALHELDKALRGARSGDVRRTECTIPDDYERADLRGKSGTFEFTVHEVKRLRPLALDSLLEALGAESAEQLREWVRDDLERERDRLVLRAQKAQIADYLLKTIKIDVPESLSARQTDRAVMRRVLELQQDGVPDHEIEARIDELRTSAREQVARDLRLEFILAKVAEKLEVVVTDEEVNSEIARIARMYNRRFDRVRDDLARRGLLSQLAELLRQDRCIDRLLRDAQIVEVTREKGQSAKGDPADST